MAGVPKATEKTSGEPVTTSCLTPRLYHLCYHSQVGAVAFSGLHSQSDDGRRQPQGCSLKFFPQWTPLWASLQKEAALRLP